MRFTNKNIFLKIKIQNAKKKKKRRRQTKQRPNIFLLFFGRVERILINVKLLNSDPIMAN